ncbi:MAG TPA: T-complex 10 C-terminal domain-containing protein [Candidatus Obscuribacterales bacterium]
MTAGRKTELIHTSDETRVSQAPGSCGDNLDEVRLAGVTAPDFVAVHNDALMAHGLLPVCTVPVEKKGESAAPGSETDAADSDAGVDPDKQDESVPVWNPYEALSPPPQVKTLEGGTVVTTHADGRQDFQYPDGSGFSRLADGTEITRLRDGTELTKYPDGSSAVKNPDGSESRTLKDGTYQTKTADRITTTWHADGTVVKEYPDSSSVTWNKDGSVTMRHDGVETTQNPDGTFVHRVDEGGEVTEYHELPNGDLIIKPTIEADGQTFEGEEVKLKLTVKEDGTKEWKSEDGTIEFCRKPDGTIIQVMHTEDGDDTVAVRPDGSSEHTMPDGMKVTRYRDGTVEIDDPNDKEIASQRCTADGKLEVVKRDGTREVTKPDGSVEITKPDGTTETKHISVTLPDGTVAPVGGTPPEIRLANGQTMQFTTDLQGNTVAIDSSGKQIPVTMDEWSQRKYDDYEQSRVFMRAAAPPPQALKIFSADHPFNTGRV